MEKEKGEKGHEEEKRERSKSKEQKKEERQKTPSRALRTRSAPMAPIGDVIKERERKRERERERACVWVREKREKGARPMRAAQYAWHVTAVT